MSDDFYSLSMFKSKEGDIDGLTGWMLSASNNLDRGVLSAVERLEIEFKNQRRAEKPVQATLKSQDGKTLLAEFRITPDGIEQIFCDGRPNKLIRPL